MEFKEQIEKFNKMCDLPINEFDYVPLEVRNRLHNFKLILIEEINEINDIDVIRSKRIDFLVELADLLGDLTVYIRSEALKYGIPLEEVIDIIMKSNLSKANEDGSVTKDARGKVMKGSNYWKPEPMIKEFLEKHISKQNLHFNSDK